MKKSHKWRLLKRDTCLKVLISALLLFCMVSAVQAAPVADFNGNPVSGPVPLIVWFTDNSTGNITSRFWNFGDSFGSILENPAHVYIFAGSFDVCLTVFDEYGDSNATLKENYITATYPEIPVFDDTDPSQAPGALTVNKFFAETDPGTGEFLAEFTAFPTVLGDNPEFTWDFDDGSPDEVTDVPETTHSYGPGIYEPEVTVHSDGMTDCELDLPTYLIVASPGMNIDDLVEEVEEV
jgi:PKD repeat protein